MGAVAVPQSTVASQPALQWVRMLTGSPGFLLAAAMRTSSSPCRPIAWHSPISSSAMASARAKAAAARSACGSFDKGARIAESAHCRLMAVGRAAPVHTGDGARRLFDRTQGNDLEGVRQARLIDDLDGFAAGLAPNRSKRFAVNAHGSSSKLGRDCAGCARTNDHRQLLQMP